MKALFPIVFGFAGIAILIFGIVQANHRIVLYKNGIHTLGTVVDNKLEEQIDTSGGTRRVRYLSYPVVEFASDTGQPIRFNGGTGSRRPDYAPGAKVEVLYERGNPANAAIYSFKQFWLAPVAATFAGVVFVLASPLLYFGIKRTDSDIAQVLRQTR